MAGMTTPPDWGDDDESMQDRSKMKLRSDQSRQRHWSWDPLEKPPQHARLTPAPPQERENGGANATQDHDDEKCSEYIYSY